VAAFNDTDPPNALEQDECTVAENVEFFYSTLGERRLGTQQVDLIGSNLAGASEIVFLARHYPTSEEIDNQLFGFGLTITPEIIISYRDPLTATWNDVTITDAFSTTNPYPYRFASQSFDGKLFVAGKTAVDRLHVWDGTQFRRVGLAQPAAPVVADEGVGTYTGTRYFRVRYIEKTGSTILLRSEPSDSTTFVPSGTGAGAAISRPALLGEGETHWEVEASTDNTLFYVIATLPVATTSYNDETDIATTDYADLGDLSEDIGSYAVWPSVRYLAADDDRLIGGGSFEDETKASRVYWSPVRAATGVGNAERVPAITDNFLDLDSFEGGGLTGISQAASGKWYAFKKSHIYQLVRTGKSSDAYTALTLSKSRGALEGSIVSGMDEYGRPCIYFLDPKIGPSRIGPSGLQQINGLRNTWKRINASATKVVARGVYYPEKQQVWWWIAVDGSNTPTLRLVLQVNELREVDAGHVKRGWSTATGLSAEALTACVLTETMIDEDGHTFQTTRPQMGFPASARIQRGDINDNDFGEAYIARIRTRPMFTTGLLNRWGAMNAALLAGANGDAMLSVKFIRNYGLETNRITTDLAPVASEDFVIKQFDNLIMSSAVGIQVEFSDVENAETTEGVLEHSEPSIEPQL